MATTGLDLAQLSSYTSLPLQSLDTLLDAPTAELVRILLEKIAIKAREQNALASEKLKLEVELENAVRGAETKNRILKSSVDKGLKDIENLKRKIDAEETTKASIENELRNLKTSAADSYSELSALKIQLSKSESSNRDTLSLLESKSSAYDRLAEELNAQHQKALDLRHEVSTLEQSVQSANAISTSAKFHEQGLRQEIESLKRNNDWLDKELKTKSTEYTKYRKEKGLQFSELQRQHDEAQSIVEIANRTETTLRRRLDEIGQKLEESFSRIQRLQEDIAKKDEDSRVELDAAKRLTELTKNSAKTERERQQELSSQLETLKEDASYQIGTLTAELETEHQDRQAAEIKVAELELTVEQLQANASASQKQPMVDSAQHHGINGHLTPIRGPSTPIGSSGTPRLKGGLSMTQMYSEKNSAEAELQFQKRRNEKLSSALDEIIQDLQTREPEVEELRADHGRLTSEIAEMSSLMDVIVKERDQALKDAKKWKGQAEAKIREGEVLRQQLRDLSSQVKVFLMEVHLHDQGQEELSMEARARFEQLAQNHAGGEALEGTTDTDRFISENLVTFRTIGELQEQNTSLLKITRELGEKMEHEESVRKQLEETRDWDDLQQKYDRCKDEVKSLVTQSQSYIRERDMFRRMLAHRGQLPQGPDINSIFDESVNGNPAPATPTQGNVTDSVEDSPSVKDLGEYAKLYKDMQAHFDAYRNEAAADRSTVKEQVDNLSRLNGELRSEVTRSNSHVTLAHERYEMLQANYAMLRTENGELQKRSQTLSDSAARQDLKVQQVAEDLVEAKGLLDSMRNENANLKAGNDFWKTVEKRMSEDNESLLSERHRLNTLNANLQTLLNERERSESEARQRLVAQVIVLEKDLQTATSKLSNETEENKRFVQRREYDNTQSQKRIDDLVTSLGTIREQLVASNTTKDHLSIRVDELTIELRSAEEPINVLQSKSAACSTNTDPDGLGNLFSGDAEPGLTHEQELAVHASEVKRDLELTKAELENVKGQVDQYKAISQTSEEELLSLNETQDLYRQETDKIIEEKNTKIKDLEQRIEDTLSELALTNSDLSDVRNEQAENNRRLVDYKKAFEAELAQLKDQDDRHLATAQYYQEDLKVQADIAQQAQQNYETELVKHADAAKALQKLRAEFNDLKLEIVEVRTEAQSARTSLSQSEEIWTESRDRYERELADLKAGRENLTGQNTRLHQQLEHVTAQISSLSNQPKGNDEPTDTQTQALGLDNLQEVIKYLRREKEIVDVQLELSSQEGKRLKQQLDYTQSQLDDARLRLNQQRKIEADSERRNLDHNKLMETINELNTYRESSVTLRNESRQAQAALSVKVADVEDLRAQIEPLRARILELKNEHETQEGEMKLLKENSDRWQQRTQNVLQKYDRVDPAELDALKEQLKTLEADRDELISSGKSFQEQAESSSNQILQIQEQSNEKMETMRARLTEQFKTRSKALSDRIKEKDAALQAAAIEKEGLEKQISGLANLQAELDSIKIERDAAIEKAASVQVAAPNQAISDDSEEGQVDDDGSSRLTQEDLRSLQDKASTAENRVNEEASVSIGLQNQLDTYRSRITELESQMKQMQEGIDTSTRELIQLRAAQQPTDNTSSDELKQQVASLREDLNQARQDADHLRIATSGNASSVHAPTEDGSTTVADRVTERVEEVRAELEARHAARVKQADEILEKRTNHMKAQLTQKLTEGKTHIRQVLTAEHEQSMDTLKKEHEHEMNTLLTRHKHELEELQHNERSSSTDMGEANDHKNVEAHQSDEVSGIKGEGETLHSAWQPSESEARAFLQSNETARELIRKNITLQVTKAKDELSTRLKAEHETAMTESQNKASTAKEHAVMMEGKKTALQVNMANNKVRISQFRIGIVERAAQETPQKAVGEVWAIAKDAKPPPATAAQQIKQQAPKSQQKPAAVDIQQPSPSSENVFSANNTPAGTSLHAVDTTSAIQNIAQPDRQGQQPIVSTSRGPPPSTSLSQTQSSNELESHPQQQITHDHASPSASTDIQRPLADQALSAQRPRPPPKTVNHHPNAGTGPGVLRGLQQSGLPVARGGSARVNPSVRGRGSGIGRDATQNNNVGQGQQQGRGSPASGGMHSGAKQFVPGNKRPRDDEQHGSDIGNGKRIRGGGGAP